MGSGVTGSREGGHLRECGDANLLRPARPISVERAGVTLDSRRLAINAFYLPVMPFWAIMTVERNNSTVADNRQPRGPKGGFFMPVFRGRLRCPRRPPPKNSRPDHGRVVNPRGASRLTTPVAPATADRGAIGMNTLPKTVLFENTELTIIDRDGTPWMSCGQIDRAIEASARGTATRIYQRHKDEFTDAMTAIIRRGSWRGRIFSPRGAHLIAMFARTPKAKAFRKWVLDVLEARAGQSPTPSGKPFQKSQRYLVVMEAGKVTHILELGDESLVPAGRVAIMRQNVYLLHRQLSVLLGEANADLLDVPFEEFREVSQA